MDGKVCSEAISAISNWQSIPLTNPAPANISHCVINRMFFYGIG